MTSLDYMARPPRRALRWYIASIAVASAVGLCVAFDALSTIDRHAARWLFNREARTWFAAASTWSEPPTFLKYSTVPPESANGPAFAVAADFGRTDPIEPRRQPIVRRDPLEKVPAIDATGRPAWDRAAGPMLFMHARTARDGTTRLICVRLKRDPLSSPRLIIEQFADVDGRIRLVRRQIEAVPSSNNVFDFWAGQPDQADPSRFTIAYEISGSPREIVAIFEPSDVNDGGRAALSEGFDPALTTCRVRVDFRTPGVTR